MAPRDGPFLIRRGDLREGVAESGGWSVYEVLDAHRDDFGRMSDAQRAVLAIGRVHLAAQWDGVLIALTNVAPSEVVAAVSAAELVGRSDMAATLRTAVDLVPGSYQDGDPDLRARLLAVHADDAARAEWEPVETAWSEYGLALDAFIDAHSADFFLDD